MQHELPTRGSAVWIRARQWRVERASRDRRLVRLDVSGCGGRRTFLSPFDVVAVLGQRRRPRHVRPQRALAAIAALVARAASPRIPVCAAAADMRLLPHQIEPVLAVLNGARRVLIADEVGLGKTVQAGLIAAEIGRLRAACRILVVAPASLRDQWREELGARFGLDGRIADRTHVDRAVRLGPFGDNPWLRPGVWIASMDYLKQPHVLEALVPVVWDLVIIDEAHDVCGDSVRHDAAERIGSRSRRIVLLTATPHSGDPARFARLARLGLLDEASDELCVFRRTSREAGLERQRHVRWHRVALPHLETATLTALTALESAMLRTTPTHRRSAALLLLAVFRKRALSTMRALEFSLARRLAWLGTRTGDVEAWTQSRLRFEDEPDDISEDDDQRLAADVGIEPARERAWLTRLLSLAHTAARHETKAARVAALLRRSREPAIVFTEFRHSLEVLAARIAPVRRAAVLHGGLSAPDRARALAAFLSGEASVLLSTDVAGQGLNLQAAARWVITLELPWNPARIEQRLGRVDRIGQARTVHGTLLIARHQAETGVLLRLAERALAARRALGSGVLDDVTPPGDAALAEHVLSNREGAPPPEPDERARTDICHRWRRHAAWVVRGLHRRRRWAACARGPFHAGAPLIASQARLPRLGRLASGTLFVFRVPICDGNGVVFEERLVPVRAGGPASSGGPSMQAGIGQAAAAAAEAAVAQRIGRVRRLRARSVAREIDIERALLHRVERSSASLLQPGLFGSRSMAAAQAMREQADAAIERSRAHIDALEAASQVAVGPAVLEIVLRPHR